jgi:Oxidoreductase molybdopterin binding domain
MPASHILTCSLGLKISGLVAEPKRLSWDEFRALPQTEVDSDFHCVTRWSRLNNHWKGVLFTDVLKLVAPKPEAQFLLVWRNKGIPPMFRCRICFARTCCSPSITTASRWPPGMAVRCG